MQNKFPIVMGWAYQQLNEKGYIYSENYEFYRMPENILSKVFKYGSNLPDVECARHSLSVEDFENLLKIFEEYPFLWGKPASQSLFKAVLRGLCTSSDCCDFSGFAHVFSYLWPNHPQTPIIHAPIYGRPFIDDNDDVESADFDSVWGYWTYEECQAIAKQIVVFYEPKHQDYSHIKAKALAYFQAEEEKLPTTYGAKREPEYHFKWKCEYTSKMVSEQLLSLKPGEGIITRYSC